MLISYEDPQHAYSGDLRDVADEIGAARAGSKRVIVPAGGAQRSAIEVLNEICTAVTKASGIKVVFASGSLRTLRFARSVQEAKDEPARDALIRTLSEAEGRMTWKLWYGPSTPLTPDLGGTANTRDVTQAVIDAI